MKKQSVFQCVAVLVVASAVGLAAARGQNTRQDTVRRAPQALGIQSQQDRADLALVRKGIAETQGQMPRAEYEAAVAQDKMAQLNSTLKQLQQRETEITARLNRQRNAARTQQ